MKNEKLTKKTFKPGDFEYVDLGLPSGRAWAKNAAPGFYTFDEAKEIFGDYLPRAAAFVELFEECKWEWDSERKGYKVTGPNGLSIFMPANGFVYPDESRVRAEGSEGNYWSRMPNSQTNARLLYFYSGDVNPLGNYYRASGVGVWPVRE